MTAAEFLADFWPEDFPKEDEEFGHWISWGSFDPKFTRDELREMSKFGVIQLSEMNKRFRLTRLAWAYGAQND
jgi:hypothetical protein